MPRFHFTDPSHLEQLHAIVFSEDNWNVLKPQQKQSIIVIMKKLTTGWKETYSTKIFSREMMLSSPDLRDLAGVEAFEVQTKLFKNLAGKTKNKIQMIDDMMSALVVSTALEEQAENIKMRVARLEKKTKIVASDMHWGYTAFDELADLFWPQGDPEVGHVSDTEIDTDTETEVEVVGNQLGGRGGGSSGGSCAVM